jgi:GNAT superfamily N-acetyltransferase
VVRQLRPDDIPACAALLERLPQWFGMPESNAHFIETLDYLPAFVATDNDRVIGFLAVERHGEHAAEITVMGIEPSMHRRGIGRALVTAAEAWCNDNEVQFLHVKTRGPSTYDEAYERTRRFYVGVGFTPLYESRTEWGAENAALVLVKHLECATNA